MSRHWQPDEDRARWTQVDCDVPPVARSWPKGATAGLLLVAAGCLALGALLYRVAGPRVVVEDGAAVEIHERN